jgi:hypothetical protein
MPASERNSRLRPLVTASALAVAVTLLLGMLFSVPAHSENAQKGNLRATFAGSFAPKALPRRGTAPISVDVGGTVATTDGAAPPQLRSIEVAINRNARLAGAGLPTCTYADVQPATTTAAQSACGAAKVGEGSFSANVVIPEQSPFPAQGKVVAYNGVDRGKPVILAHVYGTVPIPLSYTLVLRMTSGKGMFGTVLNATLPEVTSEVAYVTGISLTLDRRFSSGGRSRGYVSAGCPAPAGFPGATFALARVSFAFADGRKLGSTLTRSCRARDLAKER